MVVDGSAFGRDSEFEPANTLAKLYTILLAFRVVIAHLYSRRQVSD